MLILCVCMCIHTFVVDISLFLWTILYYKLKQIITNIIILVLIVGLVVSIIAGTVSRVRSICNHINMFDNHQTSSPNLSILCLQLPNVVMISEQPIFILYISLYSLCALQCLMLMEMSFGADGLSQLKGSVVECVRHFQLHLTRLVSHLLMNAQHNVVSMS